MWKRPRLLVINLANMSDSKVYENTQVGNEGESPEKYLAPKVTLPRSRPGFPHRVHCEEPDVTIDVGLEAEPSGNDELSIPADDSGNRYFRKE